MATFKAVLQPDPTGTGTFVEVPRNVNEELGSYRGSLMPLGDGTYCLGVLKAIQQKAGVKRGDTITVALELDTAPRTVEAPADLAKLLARDRKAAAAWDRLSFTNKKEMARSLEEAKKPETRERRLRAAVEKLRP